MHLSFTFPNPLKNLSDRELEPERAKSLTALVRINAVAALFHFPTGVPPIQWPCLKAVAAYWKT